MKALLLPFFLLIFHSLSSQSYQLTVDSVEYVPFEKSISLNNGEVWDDDMFMIPGFAFNYFGESINTIFLDSNGTLSNTSFDSYEALSAILPFLSDLVDLGDDSGESLSNISYLIEGNDGDRILKVEWDNAGFYGDYSQSMVDFQAWLYERDGAIEFYYGDSVINDVSIFSYYGGGPLVGLLNKLDSSTELYDEFIVLMGNPANPNISLWEGIIDFENTSLLELNPPKNTRYRFTQLDVSTSEIISYSNRFTIYPNPISSELNIVTKEDVNEIQSITVYSSDGRFIKSISSNFTNIDVSTISSGIYNLHIITDEGLAVKRFVKID